MNRAFAVIICLGSLAHLLQAGIAEREKAVDDGVGRRAVRQDLLNGLPRLVLGLRGSGAGNRSLPAAAASSVCG